MAGLMLPRGEAARLLGFGLRKFDRLVAAGVIPMWSDPDTGRRYYPKSALERWAATCAQQDGAA